MSTNEKDAASAANHDDLTVDLEEFGKRGEKPPKARRYRIRIDKTHYVVERSSMTGREILAVADKTPEKYYLDEKLHQALPKRIGPEETVDFATPGIERFMTLPRTETEGSRLGRAARRSGR